jgi:hypothetical protein
MTKRLSFHIQQNLTAERLQAILEFGAEGTADMLQLSAKCGLAASVLERIVLPFVRQSGLLSASGLSLSRLGIQFSHLIHHSPALFPEAMHCLLYTMHVFDSAKRFSWAYARVVDALWASGECVLDGQATARLVGMVVDEASRAFSVPIEKIAFSRDSIRGVLNWLGALEPAVVARDDRVDRFRRRHYCPPPMFLWAVDFLYRAHCAAHGVRMFLTPERIDQLCKLCVLDPSGLENVLMMTKRTSDYDRGGIFDYGTEGGFGRWILLARPCPVPSLPSGD